MSKESINDFDLNRVMKDQEWKIAKEQRMKKTLWALELLTQDKESGITEESSFRDVYRIVREKIKDFEKIKSSSLIIINGINKNEDDANLYDRAREELEVAQRQLDYFESAELQLRQYINNVNFDQNSYIGFIMEKIKKDIKRGEVDLNKDEEEKRSTARK